MILSTLSLILLYFILNAILIILVLSIGILWHTLKEQKHYLEHLMKKMAPNAIFVSWGSFGVITGKFIAIYNVTILYTIYIAKSYKCWLN